MWVTGWRELDDEAEFPRTRIGDSRSDSQLLADSANDPTAFTILYRRWATKLLSYFFRRTWDAEASADLMAETFAIAFTKRSVYIRTASPGGAWLYGIARRELQAYRRRRRIETRALQRMGVDPPAMDDESLARIEDLDEVASLREHLVGALADLSDAECDAVRLRVIEGLPFSDVARILGCSEGAARVRVHRALNRLADSIGEDRYG